MKNYSLASDFSPSSYDEFKDFTEPIMTLIHWHSLTQTNAHQISLKPLIVKDMKK